MKRIILKRKIAARIASGHPWIFNNEIEKIEGNPPPGSIVEVFYYDLLAYFSHYCLLSRFSFIFVLTVMN